LNKSNKLQIVSILYVLLVDLNLALLVPKLSGVDVEFTPIRLCLTIIIVCLSVGSIIAALLRGQLHILVVSISAYILYALIVSYTLDETPGRIETLYSALYAPLVFAGAICIFRNMNRNTLSQICSIKLGFLIFYIIFFLYMLLVLGRQNGLFINTIYFQLSIVPFIFVLRSKWIALLVLLMITACGLLVAKKTVLFLGLLSLIYFAISRTRVYWSRISLYKALSVVFICGSALLVFGILFNFGPTERALSGDSGRLMLLQMFYDAFGKFSVAEYLFGHGLQDNSSQVIGGLSVHNDFLEVFFKLGGVGLIFYTLTGILVVQLGMKLRRYDHQLGSVFLFSVLMFSLFSAVSMLIFKPSYVVQFFIFWALSVRMLSNRS